MKTTELLTFVAMMAPTLVVVCFAIFTVVLQVASATPAEAAEVHPAQSAVTCVALR